MNMLESSIEAIALEGKELANKEQQLRKVEEDYTAKLQKLQSQEQSAREYEQKLQGRKQVQAVTLKQKEQEFTAKMAKREQELLAREKELLAREENLQQQQNAFKSMHNEKTQREEIPNPQALATLENQILTLENLLVRLVSSEIEKMERGMQLRNSKLQIQALKFTLQRGAFMAKLSSKFKDQGLEEIVSRKALEETKPGGIQPPFLLSLCLLGSFVFLYLLVISFRLKHDHAAAF